MPLDSPDSCIGVIWHRYEPRFDETKTIRKNNDEGLVEKYNKIYLYDVCVKCGKIIKREERV